MNISYVNSVCVRNDAVSIAIRDEIRALQQGRMGSVQLFTYQCDHAEVPNVIVSDIGEVAFHPHFQSSALVVFHFGIYYQLFDLLPVVPRRARRLVVFHNVTPREHVSAADRDIIDRSFVQMSNIAWADHVICDSDTNLQVLRDAGIETPGSVLPLALHVPALPPSAKPSFADDTLRIAFIGRFVTSKGPDVLLRAVRELAASQSAPRLKVDLIGNTRFSDPQVLARTRALAAAIADAHPRSVAVAIHGDADDETKQTLLREADLFVLPTLHEGFCVPILEALASGCLVIAYRNSNTPTISGGLARLVTTGDEAALLAALAKAAAHVRSPPWRTEGGYDEYCRACRQHVASYAPDRVAAAFRRFIRGFCAGV